MSKQKRTGGKLHGYMAIAVPIRGMKELMGEAESAGYDMIGMGLIDGEIPIVIATKAGGAIPAIWEVDTTLLEGRFDGYPQTRSEERI